MRSTINALVTRLPGLRGLGKDQGAPDISDPAPRDDFAAWAAELGPSARVLEVGTKQSVDGTATHHQHLFPLVLRENYLMADVEDGTDVDFIADLHGLPRDWAARFDAVVAIAVFEHLERPWIAAREIERILKPDGRCYIATHQTFPLHGYPSDFFRFSKEALALIFEDAGITVQSATYQHRTFIRLPAHLVPAGRAKRPFVRVWNRMLPSYIVVHLHGRKLAGGSIAIP